MTRKIFKSIFIVTLCVLLSSIVIITGLTYSYFNVLLKAELVQRAKYVAQGVRQSGTDYLDHLSEEDARITWISPDGTVLFDNIAHAGEMENHLDREEIREALSEGAGFSDRYSDTLSVRTSYYALRLEDGTVIRISGIQHSLLKLIISMLQPILAVTAVALVFAGGLALRLSKNIVKPINEMDLDNPGDAKVYDEIKPIVKKLAAQNRSIARQMEEFKVRQTEFVEITGNMSEGLIVINNRAEILSCNQSALDMLNVAGEVPKSVLTLDGRDSFRETVDTVLSGKKGYDSFHTDEKYYSIFANPVMHDGEVEGGVLFILDETEKEKRDKLRREFTSNVSHELKTPLTSISGFAELIKSGMTDGEDTRHFAENIYREAHRLIALVGDIIKITQLDGGEIPYDIESVDLYEVARDTVERLENVASSHGISLELTGEHLHVPGNRQILEEMIYNLCDNSIKYNRRGGHVAIKIQSVSSHPVVTVKDNGIGIPRDQQKRVFERFYRVDKSHSGDIGGTGLGLSIVKHGAAYHKAIISLKSEPGAGTEVTLTF